MSSQAPSSLATTVGRNILAARADQGWTQRQLAEQLDCDSMIVSKWERGLHRPSDHNLMALALLFDREIGWFFVDHEAAA